MYKVPSSQLINKCDDSIFDFNTTDEIIACKELIGQERAQKAMNFGLSIKRKGYNIYVSGINGSGRSSYSVSLAEKLSGSMNIPSDWCYVYNFKKPNKPKVLKLKSGNGAVFKKELENFIFKLRLDIPKIFNSKEYEERKNDIYDTYKSKIDEVVNELNLNAVDYNFQFTLAEDGLIPIPMSLHHLKKIEEISSELNAEIQKTMRKIRTVETQLVNRIKQLDGKVAFDLVDIYIKILLDRFKGNCDVVSFLDEVEDDIVKNYKEFLNKDDTNISLINGFMKRYEVNLFIDNNHINGAPVIKDVNPTYYNLLGKVEYVSEMGVLKTDHTKIKAGSIHESNGGFLILNAKSLLDNYKAWEGLKRALMSETITVENIDENNNVAEIIKPQPIPLDLKIIIIGDDDTYQLLCKYDDDFGKLFKIKADFNYEMDRTKENIKKVSIFVANQCKEKGLNSFDKGAVAKIIDCSSRLVESKYKLSCCFNDLLEILYEAEAVAKLDNKCVVTQKHVEDAIKEKQNRENQYEEIIKELILKGSILIETKGSVVGQINGLSVIESGKYLFGRPNKITVSTFVGKEGVINIEREVEQSGNIYDKGVYIIIGYLGGKYAQKRPLSLNASITLEQSYDYIDGDSASSTELYALLSSLSGLPIKQAIAVTGSVNQKGIIQPIGGVNEKIEGYYDLCKSKGFSGNEGVIIPSQNINNLMLKDEIIEAVDRNIFAIYAVNNIDEGIEILTGVKAGTKDEKGNYPLGTVHYLVQKKMENYALSNKDYE
ncbi:Lon protease family protein [Abyssisolibacter fermentans]|uniref:Lon protease family protein n=1 Tax=Abyssisolibacter fermentans TaxID=1766203 RepID=UPI000B2B7B14|nr:ATP-binding protein [Abyssisolibacter fermentans]